jgi:hypothetical protein
LRLEKMKNILIMHSMRRTMLVMALVAFHLAACGGGGSDSKITTADSSGSLALSNTAPTGSIDNADSSIAPPPSSTAPATSGTGSFKVNWTAPVSRADGSPLLPSEIDGFRIYLGKAPGAYASSVNVADGTAESATVTNLASGTYYLVMTTYDVSGRESPYSPEISKRVL